MESLSTENEEQLPRYSIDYLLCLRPKKKAGGVGCGIRTEDVPQEDLDKLPKLAKQLKNREAKERKEMKPQATIGPVSEFIPGVQKEVLQMKRNELRRIEQLTSCSIQEKAGLRSYTVVVSGTKSVVEKALPMVEQALELTSADETPITDALTSQPGSAKSSQPASQPASWKDRCRASSEIAAPASQAFQIGDRVQVRDGDREKWIIGNVTSVAPLRVAPDGAPKGMAWNHVMEAYKIGERVRVRDSERENWIMGTVTSVIPLRIQADGGTSSLSWQQVKEAADFSPAARAKSSLPPAPVGLAPPPPPPPPPPVQAVQDSGGVSAIYAGAGIPGPAPGLDDDEDWEDHANWSSALAAAPGLMPVGAGAKEDGTIDLSTEPATASSANPPIMEEDEGFWESVLRDHDERVAESTASPAQASAQSVDFAPAKLPGRWRDRISPKENAPRCVPAPPSIPAPPAPVAPSANTVPPALFKPPPPPLPSAVLLEEGMCAGPATTDETATPINRQNGLGPAPAQAPPPPPVPVQEVSDDSDEPVDRPNSIGPAPSQAPPPPPVPVQEVSDDSDELAELASSRIRLGPKPDAPPPPPPPAHAPEGDDNCQLDDWASAEDEDEVRRDELFAEHQAAQNDWLDEDNDSEYLEAEEMEHHLLPPVAAPSSSSRSLPVVPKGPAPPPPSAEAPTQDDCDSDPVAAMLLSSPVSAVVHVGNDVADDDNDEDDASASATKKKKKSKSDKKKEKAAAAANEEPPATVEKAKTKATAVSIQHSSGSERGEPPQPPKAKAKAISIREQTAETVRSGTSLEDFVAAGTTAQMLQAKPPPPPKPREEPAPTAEDLGATPKAQQAALETSKKQPKTAKGKASAQEVVIPKGPPANLVVVPKGPPAAAAKAPAHKVLPKGPPAVFAESPTEAKGKSMVVEPKGPPPPPLIAETKAKAELAPTLRKSKAELAAMNASAPAKAAAAVLTKPPPPSGWASVPKVPEAATVLTKPPPPSGRPSVPKVPEAPAESSVWDSLPEWARNAALAEDHFDEEEFLVALPGKNRTGSMIKPPPPKQNAAAAAHAAALAAAQAKQKATAGPSKAKGINPLPARPPKAVSSRPVMLAGGIASVDSGENAATHRKYNVLDRPVEKVVPASAMAYEEELDPDMACYLWDRKAQKSKAGARAKQAPAQAPPPMLAGPPLRAAAAPPNAAKQRQMLGKVMEMGFDEHSARRALQTTNWSGVEDAIGQLLG